MYISCSRPTHFMVFGANVAFSALAIWMAWGLIREAPSLNWESFSKTYASKGGGIIGKDFPLRQSSPSLDSVLTKSEAFASRLNPAPTPVVVRNVPGPDPNTLATPVSFSPKKPAYPWHELRLAGVIENRGNPVRPGVKYAVIEFLKTKTQTYAKEGDWLENGLRVVRIQPERVVLEAEGEQREFAISVLPSIGRYVPSVRTVAGRRPHPRSSLVSFQRQGSIVPVDDFRLAGIVVAKGRREVKLATFEFKESKRQTYVREGEILEGNIRVVQILPDHVVVEIEGKLRRLEVSLTSWTDGAPKRSDPRLVASTSDPKPIQKK